MRLGEGKWSTLQDLLRLRGLGGGHLAHWDERGKHRAAVVAGISGRASGAGGRKLDPESPVLILEIEKE